MREIRVDQIIQKISQMCIDCNYNIGKDIEDALARAETNEISPIGKSIISDLLLNSQIAKDVQMPICQDTGMVVVFVEIGQEVHISGGVLEEAIQQGIRDGYEKGFLRKSVVSDPLLRINSKDNTPGVVYYELVAGDQLKISLAAKGFGSENMSKLKMLKPSDGMEGVENFVLNTVKEAGPNPCPPIVVGVGIGGTVDKAAQIAKKALFRNVDESSPLPHISELENRLLEKINHLGIGPQGLGGVNTALGVNVEIYPTHIAGLPIVVNINCHASRHAVAYL
ncbi:MAG: fumarate hydratase [Clostridia bacterium]|nr:fumarate hydratase [Clostridia bacterium]